jgi:dsDNA-specific endonuclease/ATPase MutS2
LSFLKAVVGWFRGRRASVGSEPELERREEMPTEETVVDIETTDTLDLHMFRPRDVPSVVQEFLNAAAEAGIRRVRIVHGKGIGVQRRIVREILSSDPRVRGFADAPDSSGWGATVAILQGAPGQQELPEEN